MCGAWGLPAPPGKPLPATTGRGAAQRKGTAALHTATTSGAQAGKSAYNRPQPPTVLWGCQRVACTSCNQQATASHCKLQNKQQCSYKRLGRWVGAGGRQACALLQCLRYLSRPCTPLQCLHYLPCPCTASWHALVCHAAAGTNKPLLPAETSRRTETQGSLAGGQVAGGKPALLQCLHYLSCPCTASWHAPTCRIIYLACLYLSVYLFGVPLPASRPAQLLPSPPTPPQPHMFTTVPAQAFQVIETDDWAMAGVCPGAVASVAGVLPCLLPPCCRPAAALLSPFPGLPGPLPTPTALLLSLPACRSPERARLHQPAAAQGAQPPDRRAQYTRGRTGLPFAAAGCRPR